MLCKGRLEEVTFLLSAGSLRIMRGVGRVARSSGHFVVAMLSCSCGYSRVGFRVLELGRRPRLTRVVSVVEGGPGVVGSGLGVGRIVHGKVLGGRVSERIGMVGRLVERRVVLSGACFDHHAVLV